MSELGYSPLEDISHNTPAGGILKSGLSEDPVTPHGPGESFGLLQIKPVVHELDEIG